MVPRESRPSSSSSDQATRGQDQRDSGDMDESVSEGDAGGDDLEDNGLVHNPSQDDEPQNVESEESDDEGGSDADFDTFTTDAMNNAKVPPSSTTKPSSAPPPASTTSAASAASAASATPATTAVHSKPGKYIPIHLRRAGGSDEKSRLAALTRRRLRGLVNRLSYENIEPVSNQISTMMDQGHLSRREVTEALCSLFVQNCETAGATRVLNSIIEPQAALVAGLHFLGRTNAGAHAAETLCTRLDALLRDGAAEAGGHVLIASKTPHNILLFIASLFNNKVVHAGLMFDWVRRLLDRLGPLDIELLLLLLRTSGWRMRQEDPASLKQIVVLAQTKAREAEAAGRPLGVRARVLLDIISDLKNNKRRRAGDAPAVGAGPLAAWVSRAQARGATGSAHGGELQVGLADFLNIEKRGRWWLVGAAWAGGAPSAAGKRVKRPGDTRSADPSSTSDADLMALAIKMRMNTALRRSIFCIIMGGADYVDAFEKLEKLRLRSTQAREVTRVLAHCCGAEQKYNPFYGMLACRLCDTNRNHKFTLQLVFWDLFKRWERTTVRQATNMALLAARLVLNFSLSLSIFKTAEFQSLPSMGVVFFHTFFRKVLETDDETVVTVFQRIGGKLELEPLRDGIWYFFHRYLTAKPKKRRGRGPSTEALHAAKVQRAEVRRKARIATKAMGHKA